MKISGQDLYFCQKCVMSNQKVLSSQPLEDVKDHSNKVNLSFKNGICVGCLEVEKKYNNHIDWEKKEKELKKFLEPYK